MQWKHGLGRLSNFNCIGLVWEALRRGRITCRREHTAPGLPVLEELCAPAREDSMSSLVHLSFDGFH